MMITMVMMINDNWKLFLGGSLLILNLFFASYGSNLIHEIGVNHPFFSTEYSLSTYLWLNTLHLNPLILLIVFGCLKVQWGFIKYVFILIEVLKYVDFLLFYNDGFLDAHAVGLVLTFATVYYVVKKIIK